MGNLTKRIITATVLLLAVILIVLQENVPLTLSLIALVLFLGFFEVIKMLNLTNKTQCVFMFFVLVVAPIAFAVTERSMGLFVVVSLIFILTTSFFANFKDLEQVQRRTFLYLLCFILLGLGGYSLANMACKENSSKVLFWLLAVISVNDICAYACGKAIGGARFNRVISPNKTVSGAICGIAGAVLASYLMVYFLDITNLKSGVFWPTLFIAWCAQIGDLIESLIKRILGVKDSSNMLPGHGGILDRVDAILGAAPLTLICFF
ncbi:MAG: phosphatidate cytidylyltransferase [Bdellovibrionota bacterium]